MQPAPASLRRGTVRIALHVLGAVVAVAVAGCGGAGEDPPSAGLPKLSAAVGGIEDPDAHELSLTTEDGEEVTTVLAPGRYALEIDDRSTLHNFHLWPRSTGAEVATDVAGTGKRTSVVVLQDGEAYIYGCDAHPDTMSVTFSVHGSIRTQN